MKIYQYQQNLYPHHISVGIVLLNEKKQVACHFYGEETIRGYPKNFHTLPHESLEDGESLEQAAVRGAKEELSMNVVPRRFVGSLIVTWTSRHNEAVEKTVPYLVCDLLSIDEVRDLTCPESVSEIRWLEIDELIDIMQKQGTGDESKILLDVKKYYLG